MILKFREKKLFYTSKGEGNPMVLLHGFLESSKIWNDIEKELSKKRQVICIDLPGHGKSEVISEVHTMELMADAVNTVLEHLKIETATFAGHSMGGYVCLAFYVKFPIMVVGMMLINSTPEADTEEKRENRDRAIALVKKNKKTYIGMAISNLLTQKNNLKFESEISELKKEAMGFSEKGIIAALEGMKIRTNNTSLLKQFEGPKWIVAGKNDPVLNFTRLQEVAKYCGCSLETYADGHLAYVENKSSLLKFMHLIE